MENFHKNSCNNDDYTSYCKNCKTPREKVVKKTPTNIVKVISAVRYVKLLKKDGLMGYNIVVKIMRMRREEKVI